RNPHRTKRRQNARYRSNPPTPPTPHQRRAERQITANQRKANNNRSIVQWTIGRLLPPHAAAGRATAQLVTCATAQLVTCATAGNLQATAGDRRPRSSARS